MKHFLLFLIFAFSLTNCSQEDSKDSKDSVFDVTGLFNIRIITHTSASIAGSILSDGGYKISNRGICWSTTQNPTIKDTLMLIAGDTGRFVCKITRLKPRTKYFVRPYVINTIGTFYGKESEFTTQDTISDIDGNVYHTVKIGDQIWMVENLKTTKYSDGTSIPRVTSRNTWANKTTGAFCDYNFGNYYAWSIDYDLIYGHLYNWYSVVDSRKLAPIGWHVPSDAEWTKLTEYLGGDSIAGAKLKASSSVFWWSRIKNTDFEQAPDTNESGFSALPGGGLFDNDLFLDIVERGFWWTTTENSNTLAWIRGLQSEEIGVGRGDALKYYGLSVRCIKDNY